MTAPPTVAFSAKAANLFFHILTRCNLRCRHCYINPAQHGRAALPLERIRAWLALFAAHRPGSNVIFLGGEPTLHPDLAQAVRAARALDYRSVTIDTNGYLFHDILAKVTPAEVDYVSFSLDGATPEVNDGLRGAGSYATCLAGMRQARARGFATSLIYTVSRANRHELAAMPALLKDLGVRRFFIQVIGIRGRPAQDARRAGSGPDLQLTPPEWLETVPAVAQEAAAAGVTVSYPQVYLADGEVFRCAGRVAHNFFVFPNGRVYQCPLCEDFPLHSYAVRGDRLVARGPITEREIFTLDIPEGCVMNRLVQPGNIAYAPDGRPLHRVACCLLKAEVGPDAEGSHPGAG
jgi:MoaA/NifB/PqqE/SkfB family radical SAM enzyme